MRSSFSLSLARAYLFLRSQRVRVDARIDGQLRRELLPLRQVAAFFFAQIILLPTIFFDSLIFRPNLPHLRSFYISNRERHEHEQQ